MKHSILHIAPENTAGVPYNFHKMQNDYGFYSRLISFYKIPYDFPEDICLNLPLPRGKMAMWWRKFKQSKLIKGLEENGKDKYTNLPYFEPRNIIEGLFLQSRQRLNESKFLSALKEVDAESFDIIEFDGGVCYYTDNRLAKRWKRSGKKIILCYFGDDLRTRGIIREMDEIADINLTFEYDHTLRHPNINFLFFPFDNNSIEYINDDNYNDYEKIKIVHSPTNSFIKGTHEVLLAVEEAKKKADFEFILLQNKPREQVLKLKTGCQIAIDQIGNRGGTGYGINSLETLSMGIPTITDMNCGMETWLPENPFIIANKDNLAAKIIQLVNDKDYRESFRKNSRDWVDKYHSYNSVAETFKKILKDKKIIE